MDSAGLKWCSDGGGFESFVGFFYHTNWGNDPIVTTCAFFFKRVENTNKTWLELGNFTPSFQVFFSPKKLRLD